MLPPLLTLAISRESLARAAQPCGEGDAKVKVVPLLLLLLLSIRLIPSFSLALRPKSLHFLGEKQAELAHSPFLSLKFGKEENYHLTHKCETENPWSIMK